MWSPFSFPLRTAFTDGLPPHGTDYRSGHTVPAYTQRSEEALALDWLEHDVVVKVPRRSIACCRPRLMNE